jgi:hypothetical protein
MTAIDIALRAAKSKNRDEIRAWAMARLPRMLSEGYAIALGDQDSKEIRMWAELLSRIGEVINDKDAAAANARLPVFQFNISGGAVQVNATPTAIAND